MTNFRLSIWNLNLLLAGLCLTAAKPASAASLTAIYTGSAGAVSQVAATFSTSNPGAQNQYFYTSVINGSGNLEIIGWQDTGSALIRLNTVTVGAASKVASTWIYDSNSTNYLGTALVNGSGKLEVILWYVNADGSLTRKGSYVSSQTVTDVAAAAPRNTDSIFATASRTTGGKLAVNVWCVDTSGDITACGSVTAGTVSQVSVAFDQQDYEFLTAVANSNGDLEVIAWEWLAPSSILREGSATAGSVLQVSAANFAYQRDILTAVVTSGAKLEVIEWSVGSSGAVTRLGSKTGEAAEAVAICDSVFCRNSLRQSRTEPLIWRGTLV